MPSLSVVIHPPSPNPRTAETEIGERSIREGGCFEEFGNFFSAMKVIFDRPKCSRLDGPRVQVEMSKFVQIEKIKWRNARSDEMRNGEFGALLR